MKSVMVLVFVSLASVTALGVYTVSSYNRSSRDMVELHNRMMDLQRQIQAQNDQLKRLAESAQRRPDSESASSGTTKETLDTVALRLNQLEQQVKQAASKTGESPSTPANTPVAEDQKQVAAVAEETVKKVLKEREQARAEQMKQDMQAEGVSFLAQKIPTLTEAQKQVIAPVMSDHAFKLAEMWWLGTAVDEEGKPLSSEERIKRSDQLRAELNEKVKAQLSASQQVELQTWINERKDKKDKNERVEGNGVWNWLFY